MPDDWKFYSAEPEYKIARAAENDYFAYRQQLMMDSSTGDQSVLSQKKLAVLNAKSAVAELVGLNPCMDQFLGRHPAFRRIN
jgi:hypothetical protein